MNNTKNAYTAVFLKAANKEVDTRTFDQLKTSWWYNLRTKNEGGLRLTEDGLKFIQEEADIKTYSVKIPKEIKITPQILVWLDNFIHSPWYLEKHSLTVLSEKSAFELYLFSGDVMKMGYSKAMSKRLSEV